MRPTALAQGALPVFLHVLADHRVEAPLSFRPAEEEWRERRLAVKFADWVEPAGLAKDSPLAPFIERKLFLTKIDIRIGEPATIQDDIVFPVAARDETYRDVEVRYVYISSPLALIPPWGWVTLIAGVAVVALLVRFRNKLHWRGST